MIAVVVLQGRFTDLTHTCLTYLEEIKVTVFTVRFTFHSIPDEDQQRNRILTQIDTMSTSRYILPSHGV